MATAGCPEESLDFIINHVILPPKLPQEADDSNASRAADQHLLRLLSTEVDSYCRQTLQDPHSTRPAFSAVWTVVKRMLSRCATLSSAQYLSAELLTRLFLQLQVEGVSWLAFCRLCCLIC